MIFPSRAFPPDEAGRLGKLVFLRLVLSTMIVGSAIMVLQMHSVTRSVVALYVLLGVLCLSTASAFLAFRLGAPVKALIGVLTGIDLAVIAMIAHYTGGSSSYFTILYVLPVLVAGEYFHVAGGLTAAGAATSFYFVYSLLEMSGRLNSPAGVWMTAGPGSEMSGTLFRVYLHMVVFAVAGLLSGFVSRRMRSKSEEIADKEKQLRRIQLDTDSILLNMSSGLVVIDVDGKVLSINPAAFDILGLDRTAGHKGKPVGEVFSDLPALAVQLEYVLSSAIQRKRHEIEIRTKNGKMLPLGISMSILRNENGEMRGVIAIFQDLTEVNEMREKIRLSDRLAAVGELSAAIAHEIRAPLASICGSVEMLKGEFELSGDNEKLMDLIISESDRLDRIITDFLEYARMRKPAFTATNIEKCVEETALLLKHSPNIGHRAVIEVASELKGSRIYADDEQIRQVFLNLGLNACEMMKKRGKLSIRIRKVSVPTMESSPAEECVQVDFMNDGPLIPKDVLPRVFEPFFTTREGGTGLGLAIAARIVTAHGGLINVRSSKEENTVFSVILPVKVRPADEESFSAEQEFCNS